MKNSVFFFLVLKINQQLFSPFHKKLNAQSGGWHLKTEKLSVHSKRFGKFIEVYYMYIVISKSKGLSEILRDIRTLTYQICRTVEKNKSNNQISQMKYVI